MIVSLTVTNFRSIRDETTLNLCTERPGKHLPENIAYPAGDRIGVIKSVGIYGANGSGKSNLLQAFEALQYIVSASGNLEEGDPIGYYEPFRLSAQTKQEPVRFDVQFITPDGVRYRYKVAFEKYRITEEQLIAYCTRHPAVLFMREASDTWETIKFGTTLRGGKKRLPFAPNNSYLSKAGNNEETPASLRNVFNYFLWNVVRFARYERLILRGWTEVQDLVQQVAALLALADTGIDTVTVAERDIDSLQPPEDTPDKLDLRGRRDTRWKFLFSHKTESGGIEKFELNEESAGTRRLFELAPVLLDAFTTGGVVLIDELESSIHAFTAELIIKLFNDPEVNPKGAQLIFTTHNVHIMSPERFRRDQIWFAEKRDGASRYFSLAQFDKNMVKPSSPFARWYLEGRFSAIPQIDYQKIVTLLKDSRTSSTNGGF
jgi:AAA15 family ATPase/GTPase